MKVEGYACDACDAPAEVLAEWSIVVMFPYGVVARLEFIRCVNGHHQRREAA